LTEELCTEKLKNEKPTERRELLSPNSQNSRAEREKRIQVERKEHALPVV